MSPGKTSRGILDQLMSAMDPGPHVAHGLEAFDVDKADKGPLWPLPRAPDLRSTIYTNRGFSCRHDHIQSIDTYQQACRERYV